MNYEIKNIMVLEDEPDILETIKIFLEIEGFTIFAARNGLEALELLEKGATPDLFILDMKMPLMNGWEFAKVYRERFGEAVPFFVMTAAADARGRAMDVGAVEWLEKPFDFNEMVVKIHQLENFKNRSSMDNLSENSFMS